MTPLPDTIEDERIPKGELHLIVPGEYVDVICPDGRVVRVETKKPQRHVIYNIGTEK